MQLVLRVKTLGSTKNNIQIVDRE